MESIRRITATILTLAALISGITVLAATSIDCSIERSCLGAALYATTESGINNTTPSMIDARGSDFALLNSIVQTVGMYTLLVSALILIILEVQELHYLKELTHKRRRLWFHKRSS